MDFSKGTNTLERNDDILREIMLRLPSNSIFRFSCVSTRWSDIITDPCFSKLYIKRTRRSLGCCYPHGRLLGFLQDFTISLYGEPGPVAHTFLSVGSDDYLEKNMGRKIGACPRAQNGCDFSCGGEFIPYQRGYLNTFSKDGLFLSSFSDTEYYVGDPITGKGETFPSPSFQSREQTALSIVLSSDDKDGVIIFRVVVVIGSFKMKPTRAILIETYSSRTREWRRWRFISETPVVIDVAVAPTLSGGFYHWFTTGDGDVIYFDSSLLDRDDMEKKKHVLQVIKVPYNKGSKIIWRSDNGQTMWYGASNWQDGLRVYRKRDDSDDWTLVSRVGDMHKVRSGIIGRTLRDLKIEHIVITGAHRQDKSFKTYYKMVSMVAFIPWNPRLIILRLGEKFFIYDCVKQLIDHEIKLHGCYRIAAYRWEWSPYFHSLSNAKYNPQLPLR